MRYDMIEGLTLRATDELWLNDSVIEKTGGGSELQHYAATECVAAAPASGQIEILNGPQACAIDFRKPGRKQRSSDRLIAAPCNDASWTHWDIQPRNTVHARRSVRKAYFAPCCHSGRRNGGGHSQSPTTIRSRWDACRLLTLQSLRAVVGFSCAELTETTSRTRAADWVRESPADASRPSNTQRLDTSQCSTDI